MASAYISTVRSMKIPRKMVSQHHEYKTKGSTHLRHICAKKASLSESTEIKTLD